MTSSSLARWIAGSALAAVLAVAPIELTAQATSPQDLSGVTVSGSYLAARHAGRMRDALAAAALLPRRPQARSQERGTARPRLPVAAGRRRHRPGGDLRPDASCAPTRPTASPGWCWACTPSSRSITARRAANLTQSVRGPITDLAATLLTAWSDDGAGASKAALAAIDKLTGPDWYEIFKDLHAGMIADLAGNEKEAGKRFEKAYKLDSSALRVVEAYAQLGRRATARPRTRLTIFEAFNKVLPDHPLVTASMEKLKRGEKLPPLVSVGAGGRRRSALRARRLARPPRRRGSRPRLSAACALSQARPWAGAVVARRSL